jgi:hypothetical protein
VRRRAERERERERERETEREERERETTTTTTTTTTAMRRLLEAASNRDRAGDGMCAPPSDSAPLHGERRMGAGE